MNLGFLAKTNSWHWLAASLAVCGTVSAFLWRGELRRQEREYAPERARQAAHLEELRMLSPDLPASLDRRTALLKARLEDLRKEVAEAGFAPIPKGPEAVLETKHALDRALTRHRLRIVASTVSVASPQPAAARSGRSGSAGPKADAAPPSAAEYERRIRQVAAGLDKSMQADFLRDAQKKIAQMKAAEAEYARQRQAAAKAAPASRTAAPSKPPFATESIVFTVEGDFRDMFRFLVEESCRKPAYHLCGFSVTQAPDARERTLRMTFTLQVNTR